LAQKLKGLLRADDVKIGAGDAYTEGPEDDTASWEDVAKVVDGTRRLVRRWVPYGMLSGTVAQPKVGKSAFVLWALVRPLVSGLGWFDGLPGPGPGCVVWCDTEGSVGINIERAKAWGLPLDRINVPYQDDPFRRIDLDAAGDIDRIFSVVCRCKARLVVVDSFRGAHGGDENNSRIGRGLQNLAGIAERSKAAVHVIHHTGKLPEDAELDANSGRGSNVFLAMVRCLIGIDRPDPGSEYRRVRVLGENFGAAPPPVGFRFTDKGLAFGPAPTRPKKEAKETGKDRAEAWLKARMKPGEWCEAKQLEAEAEALGFSPTGTLQRARQALGVVAPDNVKKVGKTWRWRLPPASPSPGEEIARPPE
jgi:hypothetical protein